MSENYKSVWLEGVDFNDEVTGGGSSLSSATRHRARAGSHPGVPGRWPTPTPSEFGRSASGAINILTKSGGNQIRGSGFYFLPRRRLRQAELLRDGRGALPPAAIRCHLGGPIKKDRIHYFATYERQVADEVATVDVPAFVVPIMPDPRGEVPRVARAHNLFNKFTATLKPGQFLSLISMFGKQDAEGSTSAPTWPATAATTNAPTTSTRRSR